MDCDDLEGDLISEIEARDDPMEPFQRKVDQVIDRSSVMSDDP
jgi:hypothetical protein